MGLMQRHRRKPRRGGAGRARDPRRIVAVSFDSHGCRRLHRLAADERGALPSRGDAGNIWVGTLGERRRCRKSDTSAGRRFNCVDTAEDYLAGEHAALAASVASFAEPRRPRGGMAPCAIAETRADSRPRASARGMGLALAAASVAQSRASRRARTLLRGHLERFSVTQSDDCTPPSAAAPRRTTTTWDWRRPSCLARILWPRRRISPRSSFGGAASLARHGDASSVLSGNRLVVRLVAALFASGSLMTGVTFLPGRADASEARIRLRRALPGSIPLEHLRIGSIEIDGVPGAPRRSPRAVQRLSKLRDARRPSRLPSARSSSAARRRGRCRRLATHAAAIVLRWTLDAFVSRRSGVSKPDRARRGRPHRASFRAFLLEKSRPPAPRSMPAAWHRRDITARRTPGTRRLAYVSATSRDVRRSCALGDWRPHPCAARPARRRCPACALTVSIERRLVL